ncbi:MFS transporter [Luteimicrobium sp. NPDC057192]|uniref:MFS transporter n=1 Tax=Luteimicrobium sp. NPDC057192 TaxID=3346042 RepID=UPI00363CA666
MSSALGRPFYRLWGASLASNLADGLMAAAAPLLALRLTDDPFAVSAITAASFLPWLLFAIASGGLVDRHDRRRVMGTANTVRFLVAASVGMLVATHHLPLWTLVVAVFVLGSMETAFDGGAQALVPAVTPRTHLDAANSRFQAGEMVMQGFVAMPIGAALFALSEPLPFALSALTFAGSAVLALTLPAAAARARSADTPTTSPASPGTAPTPVPRRGFVHELVEGARFLWHHATLRPLWIFSTLTATALTFGQGALIVYVVNGLGIPQGFVGAFTALAAVGGLVGATIVGPVRRRFGRATSMVGTTLLTGPFLAILGLMPANLAGRIAGCVAYALCAMLVMIWNTNAMTVRQSLIPAELLGRVNGTWRTVGWGLTPVATLLGGLVARSGLRLPLLIGGAFALSVALVMGPRVHRALTAVEDATSQDDTRADDAGTPTPDVAAVSTLEA